METEKLKLLKPQDFLLGSTDKPMFSEKKLVIEPGQTVILYTDGILAAFNEDNDQTSLDRLLKLFADCRNENPEVFYSNIFAHLSKITENRQPKDDMTVIIIKRA